MKSKKPFLNMDERNKSIALKIIAIMYFFTIIAMQGVTIYRQFVLGQSIYDFEDFAVILTINSLFLISALLYFGAIPIQKIKIKTILGFYLAIVIAGFLFIYIKYNIFHEIGLSFSQLLGKMIIISTISGIMVIFFVIFSILGRRKIEKELEE